MEFLPSRIPDVVLIKPRVFGDARGYFLETWQDERFGAANIDAHFVQDNHCHSLLHTLRGLHYQVAHTQGKLVRVASGAVFDVAVDVRRSSPTFGQWVGFELSAANHHMLWIPPGFAHGYLTLTERADFLYKCTDFWKPAYERSILWDDRDLNIVWPLPQGIAPLLSSKDAAGSAFRDAEYLS